MFPPPGDAYLFIVNCKRHHLFIIDSYHWQPDCSYPLALFNLLVSGGLLLLYTDAFKSFDWNPPFRAYKFAVVLFFLSNIFLVVVPLVPPTADYEPYEHLPYYVSCSIIQCSEVN